MPSAQMALDLVNNRSDILPDYELELIHYDSMVSARGGLAEEVRISVMCGACQPVRGLMICLADITRSNCCVTEHHL